MKLQAIGCLALMLSCLFSVSAQTSDKPHVLLIMVDDLNDYPAYLGGHPQAQTPHMNSLAERGYSFENAYCNSPICGPSRASMLTGKDPGYTRIYSNGGGYSLYPRFRDIFSTATGNPVVHTLPGHMKDVGGYYVAGFNKIFHGPYFKGFDNDYDSIETDPCQKALSWSEYEDFRTEPDVAPDDKDGFTSMQFGKFPNAEEPNMQDSRTVRAAIEFLDNYADNPGDFCDRPMFLAVGLYRPHNPYFAPERFFNELYRNDFNQFPYEVPYNQPDNLYPPNGFVRPSKVTFPGQDWDDLPPLGQRFGLHKDSSWANFNRYADFIDPLPAVGPGLTLAQRKDIINESARALAEMSYLATLRFADEQVGKLLFALNEYPEIRDNTIVVLVSDHGYSWGSHRHHHKSGMWETDARVPFIIYDPRRSGGQNIESIVTLMDVFPTVCELTGTPQPFMPSGAKYLDGRTLVEVMDNSGKFFDQPALMSYHGPPLFEDGDCFPQHSLRSRDFRYIRYASNGSSSGGCNPDSSQMQEELYEIGFKRNVDPNEWNNLATNPDYQEVKDFLAQWLPDGPLYLKQTPHIEFTGVPTSCSLTSSDVLSLSAELRDQEGNLIDTTATGITFEWTILPAGLSVPGATLNLGLGAASGLGASGEFTVRCRANLPDGSFLLEQQRFYKTDDINANAFSLSRDERTVSIDLTGPVSPGFVTSWDFGNGVVIDSETPPAHAYVSPGVYQVTRTLTNPVSGCAYSATKSIAIPTSAFTGGECISPGWKEVLERSSFQIRLNWNSVFGATEYVYRYRRMGFFQSSPWLYGSKSSSQLLLTNLKAGTEYEFQLASVCGSDTSDWDLPFTMATEHCSPPSQFNSLAIDSNSLDLSWRPGNGTITDQGFRIKQPFAPAAFTFLAGGISANLFDGLTPGLQYQLASVSFCPQLDGSTSFGPVSDFFYFETPEMLARTIEPEAVELFPNPTAGTLYVRGLPAGEMISYQIFDEAGKVLFFGKNKGIENDLLQLELGHLPAGYYILKLNGSEGNWSQGFSLTR